MIVGEVKLRFCVGMAEEAEVRILRFQKILSNPGPMNLMAVIAADRTQFMDASPELEKLLLLVMALKAGFRRLRYALAFK